MMAQRNILKSRAGTTLIEIMIALMLMGVITTGILTLYTEQHRNYIVQEDVVNVQQNTRAAIEELSRNIRMAGHGLPVGLSGLEAYDTNPDTLVLLYLASDCETHLLTAMTQVTSPLSCATPIDCFYDGQAVYIYNADSALGEWVTVSTVDTSAQQIYHVTDPLSRLYHTNSKVLALTRVKFFIDNTTDPDHPALMVQLQGGAPQVYAENINDLQFRYRLASGLMVDAPSLIENVREVLVNIQGRSIEEGLGADSDSTGYRYRSLSTSVFTRNIGIGS